MSTLVIKNLPEPLHDQLRAQATRNHRSVTKEVVALIEASVAAQQPTIGLPPSLKLKSGGVMTIEDIESAIAEGQE